MCAHMHTDHWSPSFPALGILSSHFLSHQGASGCHQLHSFRGWHNSGDEGMKEGQTHIHVYRQARIEWSGCSDGDSPPSVMRFNALLCVWRQPQWTRANKWLIYTKMPEDNNLKKGRVISVQWKLMLVGKPWQQELNAPQDLGQMKTGVQLTFSFLIQHRTPAHEWFLVQDMPKSKKNLS